MQPPDNKSRFKMILAGIKLCILPSMPRSKCPQTSEHPYHITGRTLNRDSFPIPLASVWEILGQELWYCSHHHELKIHSLVLMPNHFHLLATCKATPIGKILNYFMCETAKRINLESGRINHVWGGAHWKTILNNNFSYMNTYKYIYQNPVRSKLSKYCEAWPYSSLHELLGLNKMSLPLEPDNILFGNTLNMDILRWLNTGIENQNLLDLKKALSKGTFKLPKRNSRRSPLEASLI